MIGIYKITSPTKKVYIGQSINIEKRFKQYKSLNSKQQPRLNYSFLKYGVEIHIFEVIEECSIELLNERERYWQEYYNVIEINGLNCHLTKTNEKKRQVSEETKEKHRKKTGKNHPSFGKKRTDEQKKRMSEAQKKVIKKPMSKETKLKLSEIRCGNKNPFYGKKHKKETIYKISKANKDKKISEETRQKLRKKRSDEIKLKLSENHHNSKIILDYNTGVYYKSCSELCRIYDYNLSTIARKLSGRLKNNTQFKYV
jgi:hypothetical protein